MKSYLLNHPPDSSCTFEKGWQIKDSERAMRDRLEQYDSDLGTAAQLGRQFRDMVRDRRAEAWDEWLSQSMQETTPQELRGFAKGLQEDDATVRAALEPVRSKNSAGQSDRENWECTARTSTGFRPDKALGS